MRLLLLVVVHQVVEPILGVTLELAVAPPEFQLVWVSPMVSTARTLRLMPKVVVGGRRIPAAAASATPQFTLGFLALPLACRFRQSSPGVARDRRPVVPGVVSEVVATAGREVEPLVLDR